MTMTLPISPHTPCDMFAALALSPSCATGNPTFVPTLHLSPATGDPFYPSTPDQRVSTDHDAQRSVSPGPTYRALAANEAKQLSLLLTQHFFPIRHNPRDIMREAIELAEQLDAVGIRWDRLRRVMGMHLRGIWEEGQRLRDTRGTAGFGTMDLYIQGSFLTIAEEPHPLDPMPIPIDLNPASFALPRLTLHAGLANALPGAPGQFEHDYPSIPGLPGKRYDEEANDHAARPKIAWKRRDRRKNLRITVHNPGVRHRTRVVTPKTASILRRSLAGLVPIRRQWPLTGRTSVARLAAPLTGVKSARRVSFGGYEIR